MNNPTEAPSTEASADAGLVEVMLTTPSADGDLKKLATAKASCDMTQLVFTMEGEEVALTDIHTETRNSI